MLRDDQGTMAIIALQKMVGLDETEESALAGWRRMSSHEKKATENAYLHFFGEFESNDTIH